MSAAAAVAHLRSGMSIFVHGAAATPSALLAALCQREDLRRITLYHLHTAGSAPFAGPEVAGRIRSISFFAGEPVRSAIWEGRADYLPVFLSEIPALFSSGTVRLDAALLQLAPPDEHGQCSLGTSVDVALAAAQAAPLVQLWKFSYNSFGQLTSMQDPLNEITTYNLNANGFLTSIVEPINNHSTTFAYDAVGRIKTISESNGYSLGLIYDNADRIVSITFPDGTYEQWIYDKLDREWSRDRCGNWSLSLYDPLRRMVLNRDALQRETKFDHCPCGALISITNPSGNISQWAYDIQSRVISHTYPDQHATTYVYEQTTSRMKSVTDALGQTKTFSYFPDDEISTIAFPNAVNTTPTVSYVYDPIYPRMTSMTDGSGTTTFNYNSITGGVALGAGGLSSAVGPLANSTVSYTYDALGRVLTESVNGTANTVQWSYDPLGRVSQVVNALGTFASSYSDETSRATSMTLPGGLKSKYSYYPSIGSSPGIETQPPSGGPVIKLSGGLKDKGGNGVKWSVNTKTGVTLKPQGTVFGVPNPLPGDASSIPLVKIPLNPAEGLFFTVQLYTPADAAPLQGGAGAFCNSVGAPKK